MNKIISFTFAGGHKYSFQRFSKHIPNFVVIEYPQRNMNLISKEFLDINSFVDELLPKVIDELKGTDQYFLYGHSMGALIAYLICHRLLLLDYRMPQKMIISGKKALSISPEKQISNLPNKIFWDEVVNLGGMPDGINSFPELINYYLPILRYDFNLIENYQYKKQTKLNIPIDVFYGSEEAEDNEMVGWRHETTGEVKITKLSGNHFFIFDHINFFINYFENLLKEATC